MTATDTPPFAARVSDALGGALSLVFPTWCAGCDAPDVPLCAVCRGALAVDVRTRTVDGLTVWSALAFEGIAARVVRAAKEEGRTTLLRALAPALRDAVGHAVGAVSTRPARAITLVPIPTSAAAMRRRGYRVVDSICRHAGLPAHRLLIARTRTADQRALGRAERARNVAGAFMAREAAGRTVLLVDDVVTTGATLREAAAALRAAGATVLGAVTVASTPRKGIDTATDR